MVFWVFFLSISWDSKLLFYHVKSFVVDNTFVASIQDYCDYFIGEVKDRAHLALNSSEKEQK